MREKLPEGFQRAEYLKDHGIVDIVVPRLELRDTLVNLIDLLRNRTPDAEIVPLPVEGEILPPEGGDDLAEAAARAAGRPAAAGSRDTGPDK